MKIGTDAMILGSLLEIKNARTGLDIGTGTGVLALMMAQKNGAITIDALDNDEGSIQDCKKNFESSKWSGRLNAIHADFLEFESLSKYDIIVSNPPYYQSRLKSDDSRNASAKHEDSLPMRPLFENATKYLSSSGTIWLILPSSDINLWEKEWSSFNLNLIRRFSYSGKDGESPIREIVCLSFVKEELFETSFSVRNQSGDYTTDYIALTQEFHGKSLKNSNR
jgi:tRNA1Val (adenine37-N6)-methyltransferase